MIKPQTITIEKKRFAIVPEKEYLNLLQDVVDLKSVETTQRIRDRR